MTRPEILHIFTVDAHYDEPWDSVLDHARKVAEIEYASHKDTLTIWRDDWVLICTQVHDLTYHFEVNGYFKYFNHPEYVL
jgi:hypothetical protein